MKEDGMIMLTAEDGSKEAFFVWEKADIAGREYLLVSDQRPDDEAQDDEAEAIILRVNRDDNGDGETVYDVVEDDNELMIISKYFEELLEDIDIEMTE